MRIPYTKIGPASRDSVTVFPDRTNIYLPLIRFSLRYKNQTEKVIGLLDSGADMCLFPRDMAEVLEIDITKGQKIYILGIGGQRTTFYFHEVQILFDKYTINTKVGFADASGARMILSAGILGHQGFFDQFAISFDYKNKMVEIKKHDPLSYITSKIFSS